MIRTTHRTTLFAERCSGIKRVSETADGDAPRMPPGHPFQAWSQGALIRIEATLCPLDPAAARPR